MPGNRVGFINSFDSATGMASVLYPDRDNEVTDELPVFMPFGIFQQLKKGDAVLVIHLSNNSAAGIIIGSYSAEGSSAAVGLTVSGGNIILRDASGSISLSEIIAKCK